MKAFHLASRLYTAQLLSLLVLRTRICKWIYPISTGAETPLEGNGSHRWDGCSEWLTASSSLPSGSWGSRCLTGCAAGPRGARRGRRVPGPGSVLCWVMQTRCSQLHRSDTCVAQMLSPNCELVEGLLNFRGLQASANYPAGFSQASVTSQVSKIE